MARTAGPSGKRQASAVLSRVPMRRLMRGAGCEVVSDAIDAGGEEIGLRIGTTTASCHLAPVGR